VAYYGGFIDLLHDHFFESLVLEELYFVFLERISFIDSISRDFVNFGRIERANLDRIIRTKSQRKVPNLVL